MGEGQAWRINSLLEKGSAPGKSKKMAGPAFQGLWQQMEAKCPGTQVVGKNDGQR